MPSVASGIDGAPPARLLIRLLGVAEVILDGRRLPVFNSLRLQRFLGLIVLKRGPHHRSRLAFELWPESHESQARTNLRKLLHELRQSLPDIGEFVEIDNDAVRLIPTALTDVDVWRFRDALARGDLELASRLYAGDLLPGLYDDWVLHERAELRDEVHETLVQLAEGAVGRGDHAATIRYSRRIVDLEPTDEAAVRGQMEAHVALGNRAAALSVYHRCAAVLESDFAVAPGEAIAQMYQQLRESGTKHTALLDEDMEPVVEPPFVGRDRELDRLVETWDAARDGGAHLVLVTGEPGIGKTRLAQELARCVRAEGNVVASARAHEAAGRPPWGPVVDLLRSDALQINVDGLEPVWRAELARLLPELLDVSQPSGLDRPGDVAQRHRLFDAVNRAMVGERPRLLIIDDLQWCDAETIELIGFVARASQTAPVLIVGTVRSEEVTEGHPLGDIVDSLAKDRVVTTVHLDRLDEADTATLAARLRPVDALDPKLAARLWGETEGNPLFIVEAIRAGISSDGDRVTLTPTIRAVLRARLGQLSGGARRLAEVAAVIGRSFSIDLLASAAGVGEDELVEHVDELWRRRIIRDHGPTSDFSHDKLRTVTLDMVSPARRRQLHRAVAGAITAESGSDVEAASAQLAAHYDQAGMIGPAIDAYRTAGRRAASVSAFDEAVNSLRRALSLLADMPASHDRDALELDVQMALGAPLVALEGYGSHSAHRLYERALSLCHKLHRPVDPPILRGLGLARLQGCRFDDCSELGTALLDDDRGDPVAMTEGQYLLGVNAFWRGDLLSASQNLSGAIEAFDASRRDEHLALYAQDPKAVCLVRLALVELWMGDAGRADETARSALEYAVDLDHLMTLWYVITYAAILAAESEDPRRLTELLEEAERLSTRLRVRYLVVVVDALRGWLDVLSGSYAGMEEIVRSVARSRSHGETLHLTYALLLLARARGRESEFEHARAATREGISWSRRCKQLYLEAELCRVDGELAYQSGEPEVAAGSLLRGVEIARRQGARWLELRALHSLASCFPDPIVRRQLAALVETLPSGQGLSPFRAATALLRDTA